MTADKAVFTWRKQCILINQIKHKKLTDLVNKGVCKEVNEEKQGTNKLNKVKINQWASYASE